MDLIVGDSLALDVLVNRAALFLIVAEGVEHLGERKVGQPHDDFFGGDAELPQLSDRPHRRPCPGDEMIGAPWRISSVQTMYGCWVAVVMLVVVVKD